jgi:DNA-binding NarL/FixJ family response regulator
VDDRKIVQAGLRLLLEGQPDLEVVGEAGDSGSAIAQAQALAPHVIVMNLHILAQAGIDAIRCIRAGQPEVEVVVLLTSMGHALLSTAIQAGAIGCVPEDVPPSELAATIHAAARGQVYLCPAVQRMILQAMAHPNQAGLPRDVLTEREREVLSLLAAGCSNKEIAHQLRVSERTVKGHVGNVLGKLGLTSRTQAVVYAFHHGFIAQ